MRTLHGGKPKKYGYGTDDEFMEFLKYGFLSAFIVLFMLFAAI
jgi:hypothetical protein